VGETVYPSLYAAGYAGSDVLTYRREVELSVPENREGERMSLNISAGKDQKQAWSCFGGGSDIRESG
jgi:hypothetical protein